MGRVIKSVAIAASLVTAGAAAASPVSTIPVELSVGGMFAQADWIVKIVIIGLIVASLVSWTIFIAKLSELRKAMAAERVVHDEVAKLRSLDDAGSDPMLSKTALVQEASAELALSADALQDGDGIKERIVSRFERYEAALSRKMTRGVNILATIGATAPFVGLFGTVWGIMNSFQAIAISKNTSLAVVAPGIAEALFATALGLLAAIPAVIAYNKLSKDLDRYESRLDSFAGELAAYLSREMEGGGEEE